MQLDTDMPASQRRQQQATQATQQGRQGGQGPHLFLYVTLSLSLTKPGLGGSAPARGVRGLCLGLAWAARAEE